MPETLTVEEVLNIHYALVEQFAAEGEPIEPRGVRSMNLLASAISRQHTGLGQRLKYPEARHNAATLLYGICMDHPFHNGNKRTALVATLVHLDKNGYIPDRVTHADFYNMVLAMADHRLTSAASTPRGGKDIWKRRGRRVSPDQEVSIAGEWLRRRTRVMDKREHPLTFRQLSRILSRYNCRLGKPRKNFVDIYRDEEWTESGWFGLGRPKIKKRSSKVTQVAYSGENQLIPVSTIKMIRKRCHLMPEHGVDSRAFYDAEATVDFILNAYRNVLRKLARA